METRIKTSLWVDAHVRTCFAADMPAFVVHKGDAERGGIILKLNRFLKGVQLFEQSMDFDGNKIWRQIGNFNEDFDRENDMLASEVIAKKRNFDPDIWVLEIEDMKSLYELDAPISEF